MLSANKAAWSHFTVVIVDNHRDSTLINGLVFCNKLPFKYSRVGLRELPAAVPIFHDRPDPPYYPLLKVDTDQQFINFLGLDFSSYHGLPGLYEKNWSQLTTQSQLIESLVAKSREGLDFSNTIIP